MDKTETLSRDLIWGTFRPSDYGLIVGSFSYSGESEDDIGMNISTVEEFLGHNPVPVYLGQKYTDKLKMQITLIKNPCVFHGDLYFSEKDCRALLRILTGANHYRWLKLITQEFDEDLWYKARISNVSYKRMNGHVAGIILCMECDSCFAWSKEYRITINAAANQPFYIFNSTDDLNSYVFPVVTISPSSAGTVSITNLSDGNWATEIKNVKTNERITIDSQNQTISSDTPHDLLLDDFNLGWVRLVPDKNEYVSDKDVSISIKFRAPRKAGVIE